jgi:uncharacterized membrane protein YebE (DUF533 family)
MFDARKLLDTLIGAAAQIGQPAGQGAQPPQPGVQGQGAVPGLDGQAAQRVQQVTGQSPEQLLQKARQVMESNPGLAQAAAVGLAGLLFTRRKSGRGLSSNVAKLGGLAVIGGLAYKAWQNSKAGKPLLDVQPPQAGAPQPSGGGTAAAPAPQPAPGGSPTPLPAAAPAAQAEPHTFHSLDVPQGSSFHPVSYTEDDALLFLRAMVAAASADGRVDEAERGRIVKGLTEAGIDAEATRWLDRELAAPADVEELAAGITNPEKAAQVYAAARVAIDPDTMQEREFLRQLAEALDLDQALKAQIDETAGAMAV